jgi:hypothetical protein
LRFRGTFRMGCGSFAMPAALQADALCGFSYAPPPNIMVLGRVTLRFHALPDMTELQGSPTEINFPDVAQREWLAPLTEKADACFRGLCICSKTYKRNCIRA